MKKMNPEDLKKVVQNMRSLADSIEALYEKANDKKVADVPSEVPAEPEAPAITLEEVRKVLAEKSRSGKTGEVWNLINKYGAMKLSAVDPKYYADLLKDAEGL